MARITFNGRQYDSVEQMPPDARREYERVMQMLADRDGNGIPDILERGNVNITSKDGSTIESTVVTSTTHIINGREYQRVEDIPPHLREMIKGIQESGGAPRARLSLEPRGGRLTFHMSATTLLAILAAVLCTALIAWVMLR
jgi:hypothetical protein